MISVSPDKKLFVPEGLEEMLLKHKPTPTRISLDQCPVGVPPLIQEWIKSHDPNIEEISLSHSKVVNDDVIASLLGEFKNLKTLDLSHTSCFTYQSFQHTKTDNIETLIFDHCGEIGEGKLVPHTKSHKYTSKKLRYTPHVLELIFKNRVDEAKIVTKILSFFSEYHWQHKDLVRIVQLCPNLRVISLKWCLWMTSCTLRQIVHNAPKLEIINLGHCRSAVGDDTVLYIAQKRKLKGIGMNFCQDLTDDSLKALLHDGLEFLEVSGCRALKLDYEIPKGSLNAIDFSLLAIEDISCISNCIHLETLDLQGNKNLKTIKGISNLSKMKHLNLLNNPQLDGLGELSTLVSLKTLIISKDFKLDDSILIDIFKNCILLEKLHIISCDSITDKAIDYYSGVRHDSIRDLDISGCSKITNATVLWLVQKKNILRFTLSLKLSLDDKTQIDDIIISQIKLLRPGIIVSTVKKV